VTDDWVRVASLEDVPPGTLHRVELDGVDVVLANVDGDIYALEDRCSHEDYPLSDGELTGSRLECIYHGAAFDVCSGLAQQLPAIRPVKSYPAEVRGNDVYIQPK
jgi:3-phenylpropionate/trans-cinnamate dioxygenase ferredoxin subunit